jgi:hypothetical protein
MRKTEEKMGESFWNTLLVKLMFLKRILERVGNWENIPTKDKLVIKEELRREDIELLVGHPIEA